MELAIPSVDGDWRACTAAPDSTNNETPATLQKPLRTRVATALSINTPFRNHGLTRDFRPQCDAMVFKMQACMSPKEQARISTPSTPGLGQAGGRGMPSRRVGQRPCTGAPAEPWAFGKTEGSVLQCVIVRTARPGDHGPMTADPPDPAAVGTPLRPAGAGANLAPGAAGARPDPRPIDAPELAHLQRWQGRTEGRSDMLPAAPVRGLSAPLDRADPEPVPGSVLPPLWHWLYFLPQSRHSEIGPDGHPRRGGFLPPVPLPRRMWAGGRLHWQAGNPLRVGDAVEPRSCLASVSHKTGRIGDLLFVLLRHELHNAAGLALTEEHDIVYRSAARPGDPHPPPHPAPPPPPPQPPPRPPPPRPPGRPAAPPPGGPCRRSLAARGAARRGAAVSLLGADLQRPPHPLRPPLCERGRRLPRPDRAWPADRHAAAGPAAPRNARGPARPLRVQGRAAGVRPEPAAPERPARGRWWQRRRRRQPPHQPVGPGPLKLAHHTQPL